MIDQESLWNICRSPSIFFHFIDLLRILYLLLREFDSWLRTVYTILVGSMAIDCAKISALREDSIEKNAKGSCEMEPSPHVRI